MGERFSEAFLDDLRAAVRITDLIGHYVSWENGKGRDGDKWANCPFHGESTPSFHATDDKQSYHCFGCGVSGDHFAFLTESQGMTFPDAVKTVAELAGIPLPDGMEVAKGPKRAPEQPRAEKSQPQARAQREGRVPVKVYPYTDNDGNLLYEVVRFQIRLPDGSWAKNKDGKGTWKDFRHRRLSGLLDGSRIWGMREGDYIRPAPGKDWSPWALEKADKWPDHEARWFDGVEHTIYRHPEVEIAIAEGRPTLIVEGEKDADTAAELGYCGTTNSSGSKHWTETHAVNFRDADVIICLDNDEAGDRAEHVAKTLKGIARRIRVLDFAEHVPDFPAKGDLTDWVEQFGGDGQRLGELIAALPDWKPKPPRSTFGAQTSNSIAKKPVVYDWLVKNLIERNGILIIAGESQAGKSFLVMDMGMKIARGVEYAGHRVKQGAVIHMAVEDGKGTELRHKGYRKANGISPDADVPYVIMDPFANSGMGFSLMSDEQVDKFITECMEWKEFYGSLEFIIIDTLSMATEGMDENSSGEASKVLGRVNRIRERTGATVCIVHHMNAGGTRVRGSTAIVANVPNVIELKPMMTFPQNRKEEPRPILDGDKRPIRRARLAKNKNGAANISWAIVLAEVELDERDEDGEPFKTMICARPTPKDRDSEPKSKITSEDQRLVMEALTDALADHGKDMPSGVRVGPQIKRCVAQKDFVAYVRQRMQFKAPEDEQEARQTELAALLKRTTTTLQNNGYLGRDNDKKIIWSLGKDKRQESYSAPSINNPEPPPAIPDDVKRELEGSPDEPPF